MEGQDCTGVREVDSSRCFLCGKIIPAGMAVISVDIERNRVLSFCSDTCKERQRPSGYIKYGNRKAWHYNKFPRTRRTYIDIANTEPTFPEFVKKFKRHRR